MYIENYDYGARVLMTPADKEHFIEVIKMLYTIDCKNIDCTKACPCYYVCKGTAQILENMLRYVKEI